MVMSKIIFNFKVEKHQSYQTFTTKCKVMNSLKKEFVKMQENSRYCNGARLKHSIKNNLQ